MSDREVLRLFREAEKDLIAIIEKANPARKFSVYRTVHLREMQLVIFQLEKKLGRVTKREIGKIVRAGAKETADMIRSFDEKEFRFSFGGVNKEAVEVLTSGALNDWGNTILALRTNATKALFDKKKLNDKIIQGVIQGSSVSRTQNQLIDTLKSGGITVLKAKNGFGRRFSLQDYTNILVRNQTMSAYNIGAKNVMLGSGRRFAKIATLRPDLDGDDICNRFEEQIYIDLNDPEQLPPYHPRCRHVPIPVSFAELKANRPDLYAIATRFYEHETR